MFRGIVAVIIMLGIATGAMIQAPKPEEEVVIRLPVHMGTGFSWHVESKDDLIVGKPKLEDVGEEEALKVGAAQCQVFRILMRDTDKKAVEFHYRRPFEKNSPPRKVVKVIISK
jgi:inhibitor of cysteine peptidase